MIVITINSEKRLYKGIFFIYFVKSRSAIQSLKPKSFSKKRVIFFVFTSQFSLLHGVNPLLSTTRSISHNQEKTYKTENHSKIFRLLMIEMA